MLASYLKKKALVITAAAVLATTIAVSAQTPGPTAKDCYSSAFHAASDCDRIALAKSTAVRGAENTSSASQAELAEQSHWAYLREVFRDGKSPYLVPVTGDSAP